MQILSGVRPGEEVVTVGGLGLDDKAKVKIIDTTVKEAEEEPDAADSAGAKDAKDQQKKPKKDEAKPKTK